jgi:hypothetical protein
VQTPPGWYRDPSDPAAERWWDGGAWTGAVRHGGGATPRPSRRGRDIAAVGAVVVITVVLAALVALSRHGAHLPAPAVAAVDAEARAGVTVGDTGDTGGTAGAEAGSRAEVPADGLDFVEPTGAYSLRVGTAWDAVDIPRGIGWYTGEGSRRFRDNVTVLIEDLARPLPLDEYVRLSVAAVERTGMRYDEVDRRGVVLPDGNAATLIDYRSEQNGFSLGHRVVIALRGRVAVSVTFTTESERFAVAVRDVGPYLTSVQVR